MTPAQAEKRRFFRINDNISLSYELLDPDTAKRGLNSSVGRLDNQYSLAATLDVLAQESTRIMQRLDQQGSEMLELYKILDAKMNALAQVVMFVGSSVDRQTSRQVNLSATGLAFQQAESLALDQYLAIEMYLPTTLALIKVYGKVVNCQTLANGQYSISVDYTHIQEEDRELLIKHVVRKQWQQLRENSPHQQPAP